MVIYIAIYPVLICVWLVLLPFSRFSQRIAARKNKLQKLVFWSYPITLMNESISMISICAFINVLNLSYDSKFEYANSVLSIAFLVICVAYPIFISLFLIYKLPVSEKKPIEEKYEELVQGLDIEQGRVIVIAPFNFLVRRLLLVAVVIFTN